MPPVSLVLLHRHRCTRTYKMLERFITWTLDLVLGDRGFCLKTDTDTPLHLE